MATSTFGKQFTVRPEKEDAFVEEMTRQVAPTLTHEFHTKLTHLMQDQESKENLLKALNR